MSLPSVMPFRVDFWSPGHSGGYQRIGRVDALTAAQCTILTHANSNPGTFLELRLHLDDRDGPLRVTRARAL